MTPIVSTIARAKRLDLVMRSPKPVFFVVLAALGVGFLFVRRLGADEKAASASAAADGGGGLGGLLSTGLGVVTKAVSKFLFPAKAAAAPVTTAAALGPAVTAAFVAVWAKGMWEAVKGVISWNKPKSPEQFAAERAMIDELTAKLKAEGKTAEEIASELALLNWWLPGADPGSRGGGLRGGK